MNPKQPPVPSFNLPEPVEAPASTATPTNSVQAAEIAGSPIHPPQAAPAQQNSASFGDELDPQWIQTVEQAIRAGIDDPRALSLRLDEIRAEYIYGRFAKEVKRQSGGEK